MHGKTKHKGARHGQQSPPKKKCIMKARIVKRIIRTLATASQLIIAAPVRLPPKVLAVAQYVSLGAALLEAIAAGQVGDREQEDPGDGR